MAKVKGIVASNWQGRVGNVVFRNRDGVNIASQRPASVKNPRSSSQQSQRMKFATITQAYGRLRSIVDHSFEGVPTGARSQQEFSRLNFRKFPTDASAGYAPLARTNQSCAPMPFIVSKGTISPIDYTPLDEKQDTSFYLLQNHVNLSLEGLTDTTGIKFKTLRDLWGVQPGDQITFMAVKANSLAEFAKSGGVQQIDSSSVQLSRIVFAPTLADDREVIGVAGPSGQFFLDSALDVSKSYGVTPHFYKPAGEGASLAWKTPAETYAAAIIISRKVGSTWLRSTQSLAVVSGLANDENKALQYVANFVLPTYDPTSELYLNHAAE